MFYVTDTHPFLWYLTDDNRLSRIAKEIFDKTEKGEATIILKNRSESLIFGNSTL